MHRTDYDFDVIAGPAVPPPAPQVIAPRRPHDPPLAGAADIPAEKPAQRGGEG